MQAKIKWTSHIMNFSSNATFNSQSHLEVCAFYQVQSLWLTFLPHISMVQTNNLVCLVVLSSKQPYAAFGIKLSLIEKT